MTEPVPTSQASPPVRASVIAAIVVLVLILAAGGVLAFLQKSTYTAETEVVVLPQSTLDLGTASSYYETLASGQIVATFAELAGRSPLQLAVEDDLALTDAQRESIESTVSVVPNTSVILVSVSAGEAAVAEDVADSVAAQAITSVSALSAPFRFEVLGSAKGTAEMTGPTVLTIAGLAVAVALVAALTVQQLVYHLVLAYRRRSRPEAQLRAIRTEPRGAERPSAERL